MRKFCFVEKLRPVDINEYKCVFVVLSGQMYFRVYYTEVKSIIQTKYMVMSETGLKTGCPKNFFFGFLILSNTLNTRRLSS